LEPLQATREVWLPMLMVVALLSLFVGNLAAISQTNVKRMLAYSSISHAGYMLLGLVAGNETGIKGIFVYLVVYTFMNLGALLVIVAMRRSDILGEDVDDLAGLVHKHPVYALFMLVFMLSLAGIPPTAGFLGKYYIFLALVEAGYFGLAIVAALFVAVAIYYYFRIVKSMFVREPVEGAGAPLASSVGLRLALGVTGVLTLLFGIYPEPLLRYASDSLLK
jgi:NADH-quinone oxidoreductase subunit N